MEKNQKLKEAMMLQAMKNLQKKQEEQLAQKEMEMLKQNQK